MAVIIGFDFKTRVDLPNYWPSVIKEFPDDPNHRCFPCRPPPAFASSAVAAQQIGRPPAAAATAGDIQRFRLGDLRITALSDGTVPQDFHKLQLGITPQEVDNLLGRPFLKNPVEASINAFLLETHEGLVLIDTGAGEVFGPGYAGRLVDSLAVAGGQPSQIRHVLITHVHSDHSGGLVVKGRPLLPNAVIHVGKPDVDFLLRAKGAARLGYADHYFSEAETALRPYLDRERLKTFDDGEQILPGMTAAIHAAIFPEPRAQPVRTRAHPCRRATSAVFRDRSSAARWGRLP